ncbi:MAG: tripartite tricarboxylate transporter substrate-binding protein [Pseudomonadota bacterium]
MKTFLTTIATGLALAASAGGAAAQNFPNKPIQIVVSAAPGGSPDILARIIGDALSKRVGQSVVIENKPGGAGNIAAGYVAKAAPDGYTIFVATDGLSVNQTLFHNLPFHAVNSFAPIIHAISSPQVFAVNAGVPVNNVKEFIAASVKPGAKPFSLASPAIGTPGQLGVLLLQNQAAVKVTPVVYKSAQPALTDVLGKHADGIIVTIAPALPFLRDGKLKPLAVSTAVRSRALPDVPTFAEQGLPGLKFGSWQGFVAPAGTPRPVIEKLNREINAVLKDPVVHAALLQQAFDVEGGSPEAFGKVIADGITGWATVISANNIQPD